MAAAAVLGLAQGAVMTRLSLARTALLLSTAPPAEPSPAIGKAEAPDFADEPEHTAWGPAHRLRPPVSIGQTVMRWDQPAGPLGSAEPVWQA
jgi:hypothetical protein